MRVFYASHRITARIKARANAQFIKLQKINAPTDGQNGCMKHNMAGAYSTHRLTGNSWRGMRNRCDKASYWAFKHYGGRGISYDPRWKDFSVFLEDMGERPGKEYSLDRIDNNADYTKENCRWVTQKEQVANSSRVLNAKVTADMLKKSKVSIAQVYKRLRNGWSVDDALNKPVEDWRKKEHEKAIARRRSCKICGQKVKSHKTIYCSRECYQKARRWDYEQKKKLQAQQAST